MDQLALELGIRKQEDWYHTHHTELVIQRGATFIKTHYNGSIHNALQTIYPGLFGSFLFNSSHQSSHGRCGNSTIMINPIGACWNIRGSSLIQ
jgi:hypothetical protein